MHEILAKSILSAKNTMNIYRGCTHGCIYCDSRSVCYQKTYPFEEIEVKVNAIELLDAALSKKRKPCMISTGGMTDCYLPLEAKSGYMRRALETVERHGCGITLLTKSDLILRDLDILKRINDQTKCVVQMTLTTYDEQLCRILEPNVCTTKRRFEVLQALNEAGIPTIVWISPILPFINDTEENIMGLLNYCKIAKVHGILNFGMGLTLRQGNREYFYHKLDDHFPTLKRTYINTYGSRYGLHSPRDKALSKLIQSFCRKNDMLYGISKIFDYCGQFPIANDQFSLFDD